MKEPAGALHGVRVLDLAEAAGALCGKLLADMGADVVSVEPPRGACLRRIGPFYDSDTGTVVHSPPPDPHPDSADTTGNRSLFFWHYNTNKRSVTIDLD